MTTYMAALAMIIFVLATIELSKDFNLGTYAASGASGILFLVSWAPAGVLTLLCLVIPGSKNENRFGQANDEGQTLAKLWGSFRAFNDSFQRNDIVFLVTSPYFVLRLAISFLLELMGLYLVWLIDVR